MPNQAKRLLPRATLFSALIALIFGLSACDGMIGATSDETARLRVRMIDAPFPFDLVQSANVTINRVDIHSEATGSVTISEETENFNLLDLTNGVSALLGDVEIAAGTYDAVHLYVEDASIVMKNGTVFDVKVPSNRIKVLLHGLEVEEGEDVTLTIDFDVSKSFVVQGNPFTPAGIKGFLFKPTVVTKGVQRRNGGEETNEIKAGIDAIGADYIEINGSQYLITDDTEFDGTSLEELEVGTVVEIEFVEQADGTLVATKVEVEDGRDDDDEGEDDGDDEGEDGEEDELEAEGTVTAVGADYIEIDGAQYFVTADTEFEGGDFASIAAGTFVEIEYVQAEDGSFVATKVEIEEDEEEDEEEEEEDEEDEEDLDSDEGESDKR